MKAEQTEREAIQAMFHSGDGIPLKMAEHKPRMSLVPYEAKAGLAAVYEYGLTKYERDSWRKLTPEQAKECLPDAAERHLAEYNRGNLTDAESGLPHLLQVAWNCITLHIQTEGR